MNKIKERLIEVCNTILYSNEISEVVSAYDIFFTQYRQMIVSGSEQVHLSCVEDVIYKILYDETFNKVEKFGLKYSPFARFISMIKEQERIKRIAPAVKKRAASYKYPLANLKNYILIVAQTEEEFEKKNTYLKDILHQCYVKTN